MYFCESSAVVTFVVAGEFEAGHHGVAERPFHELVVREAAGEMLKGGDDTGVAHPEKFTVVVQGIQQFTRTLVDIVKAFPVGKAVAPKVLRPAFHLLPGNIRQFFSFPVPEMKFLDFVPFLDGQGYCLGNFFGKAYATQKGAGKKLRGLCVCLEQGLDGSVAFLFEGGGDVEIQTAIAEVVGVVRLCMSNGPENHDAKIKNNPRFSHELSKES